MLNRVVAISGWRGSGKDLTGSHLSGAHDYVPISFAKKLKDLVADTYNVPRGYMDDQTKKEMPLMTMPVIGGDGFSSAIHTMLQAELAHGYWTPRALCILEGSIKRSVYSNFWVREVVSEILLNPEKKYVITDMRYRTEADTLKLLLPEVTTLRINRFENIYTNDPSERDLDGYQFDHVVQNHGTREDLFLALDALMYTAETDSNTFYNPSYF